MNNYIVNPSIFYWMNVLDSVRGVAAVTLLISVACLIIALILYFVDGVEEEEDEPTKQYRKLIFISGIVIVISILITIFIPDKRTSIEMLIARTATYENAQLTVQGIKEIVDYIVQAINGI